MDAVRSAAHALRVRLIDRLKAKRGGGRTPAAVAAPRCRDDNEVVSTRGVDDWGIYEEIPDGGAIMPCTYEDFANCNLRLSPGYRDRVDEAEVYGLCGGGNGGGSLLVPENHTSPPVADPDGSVGSGGESTLETLVALHAYAALEPGLLSFERGDLLDVLVDRGLSAGGWWLASNSRGQVGLVPSNYLAFTTVTPVATTASVAAAELASTASAAATVSSIVSAAAPIVSVASGVTTLPKPAGDRPRPAPRHFSRSPQPSAEHDWQRQRAEMKKEQQEEGQTALKMEKERQEEGQKDLKMEKERQEEGQNERKHAEFKELERRERAPTEQPECAPAPALRRPSCRPASEQQQRRSAPPASQPQQLPPSPPRPRPRASTATDGPPQADAGGAGSSGFGDKSGCVESEYATVDAGALSYFHAGVERDECKRLLVHDGDYLLRDSRNGNLTLSVKGRDRIHHFLVSSTMDGRVAIGRFTFPHIAALTDHYREHAIYKSADERLVLGRAVVFAPAVASSTLTSPA